MKALLPSSNNPSSNKPNGSGANSTRLGASWLVFWLYVGLTIVMTMPLILRLGSHLPAAEGSDVWIHEWTFWWIERALLNSVSYTHLTLPTSSQV